MLLNMHRAAAEQCAADIHYGIEAPENETAFRVSQLEEMSVQGFPESQPG
jgi:hypothetical protein